MTRKRAVRWLKGTLVSAVATVVCYRIWVSLREWSDDVSTADPNALYAGWVETLLANVAGVAAMPLLLWAGMRILGERGNHLLVWVSTPVWLFTGGKLVDELFSVTGAVLCLTLFAAFASVLSLAEVSRN